MTHRNTMLYFDAWDRGRKPALVPFIRYEVRDTVIADPVIREIERAIGWLTVESSPEIREMIWNSLHVENEP